MVSLLGLLAMPAFPIWRHGPMPCSSTPAFSPCRCAPSFFWLAVREMSGRTARHGGSWRPRAREREPGLGSAIDLVNEIRCNQGRAASDGQEQPDHAEPGSEPFKGGGSKDESCGARDYAQGCCRYPHGEKPGANVKPHQDLRIQAASRLARRSATMETACPTSPHGPKISTKSVRESVDKTTDHLVGSFVLQQSYVRNRSAHRRSRTPAH